MSDQSTHIEGPSIDELLAAYRDLQAQFERARARVRRADEHKHTVQRRIYDRVRTEYDRELDSIRARMSPIRDEIDRLQQAIEAQLRDAMSSAQAVEEELAEAEFRNRIGEYEESAFGSLRRDLDDRARDAGSRRMVLQSSLSAIAALLRPESRDEPPAPEPEPSPDVSAEPETNLQMVHDEPAPSLIVPDEPEVDSSPPIPYGPSTDNVDTLLETAAELIAEPEAVPVAAPVVEETVPRRPVLSAGSVAGLERLDSFENPHDWIADTDRRARPVPPPPPAPSAADSIDSLLTPAANPANGFPSLVFVSGVHAGQAVALLPTTLTIGREHDNNIEIKDPEVARYHARILRERDDYVVEDLNSSTGTWINGKRVRRSVISHGDVIRVGQTELALDYEWTTDSR